MAVSFKRGTSVGLWSAPWPQLNSRPHWRKVRRSGGSIAIAWGNSQRGNKGKHSHSLGRERVALHVGSAPWPQLNSRPHWRKVLRSLHSRKSARCGRPPLRAHLNVPQGVYRATSLIRKRPPPRTTVGPPCARTCRYHQAFRTTIALVHSRACPYLLHAVSGF